jgi:SAM-dependent methyltransferase
MAETCPICPACGGGRWTTVWRGSLWRLLRCRSCGLARVWPLPTPGTLKPLYSERYFKENYLASRFSRLAHFRSLWEELEPPPLRPPSGAAARGRLLDVGCGPGFFLEVAAERGWECWGVEPSAAAEHVSRALRPRVARCGFGEERLPAASFEVVTFWDSLAHLPEPARALQRAATLLRGGGLLVVKTPTRSRLTLQVARLFGNRAAPLLHVPQQIYHFTPAALRSITGACGFEEVLLRPVHEAPRPAPPAPTAARALARRLLRLLERVLNPRPSLLLVARRALRPDDSARVAEA